jgi:cobalt-zinc-cadmium efflux system outer membrane protein
MSAAEIDVLLADGLSLVEAPRLALTHSRELQAEFQEIGIAHADWVQSRLLSNPSLDVLWRFPTDGGRSMLEAVLGLELLELWRIPARAEAAQQQLEATALRIARSAGVLLAETRMAYHAGVAAAELERVAAENVALTARSSEAVQDLHAAGAADVFEVNLARGPWLAAQLDHRRARTEAAERLRDLARLLSLEQSLDGLRLTDPLPEPAAGDVDVEALVQLALESRLDLRALSASIDALEARAREEGRKSWGDLAAGPAVERPAESGGNLVGPSLEWTVPLFDQNQAQVARVDFELARMLKLREAARVAVAQDVRSSAERVDAAASNLEFHDQELLPQAARSVVMARESYAAGRTTLVTLIEVQRRLLEARRSHVILRLEAASSASELQQRVGVPLP